MNGGVLDNVFFLTFLAWPGVILGCALLNMLLHWSFSWSELCIDYLVGIVVGLCFYFGTDKKAHEATQFFLVFSNGLPGLLHVLGVKALQHRDTLFAVSATLATWLLSSSSSVPVLVSSTPLTRR